MTKTKPKPATQAQRIVHLESNFTVAGTLDDATRIFTISTVRRADGRGEEYPVDFGPQPERDNAALLKRTDSLAEALSDNVASLQTVAKSVEDVKATVSVQGTTIASIANRPEGVAPEPAPTSVPGWAWIIGAAAFLGDVLGLLAYVHHS